MKYIASVCPLLMLLIPIKSAAQDNLISRQLDAVKEIRQSDRIVDGLSYRYRQGDYYKRVISFNPHGHEITMQSVQGNYSSRFHSVKLIMHGFPSGTKYTVNGRSEKVAENGSMQIISFNNDNGKIAVKW